MNIALTGAKGFIGSHTKKFYEEKGHTVHPIDRDLLNYQDGLRKHLEVTNPNIIIHAAAYGNMSNQKDEEEIFLANVIKSWNLLQASKDINYIRFIFISSSSVYGDKYNSMSEKDSLDTDTFYGCTKVSAEYLCRAFRNQFKKNIQIVRPFSVYGEGEADFRFIPTICRSLLEDKEFTLEPEAEHDWIHVDDFVQLMDKIDGNEIVNIGTGMQVSNLDIVEALIKISGRKAKLCLDYRGKKNNVWKSSSNYGTKIDLYEGLERVWKYEQQRFEKENH